MSEQLETPRPKPDCKSTLTDVRKTVTYRDVRNYEFRWHIRDFQAFRHEALEAEGGKTLSSPSFRIRDVVDVDGRIDPELGMTIKLQFERSAVSKEGHGTFIAEWELPPPPSHSPTAAGAALTPLAPDCWTEVTFAVFDDEGSALELIGFASIKHYSERLLSSGHQMSQACNRNPSLSKTESLDVVMRLELALNKVTSIATGKEILGIELKKFFGTKELTDFNIICRGESFPTYRLLLATRSDFFRTMFQHPEVDHVNKKVVTINDVSPGAVQIFLDFLLSETVDPKHLELHAKDLYDMAHRYFVQDLKIVCREFISQSIGPENCGDSFYFGHLHEDESIMSAVTAFFKERKTEVMNTDGWKRLREEHPEVEIQFLSTMIDKLVQEEKRHKALCFRKS